MGQAGYTIRTVFRRSMFLLSCCSPPPPLQKNKTKQNQNKANKTKKRNKRGRVSEGIGFYLLEDDNSLSKTLFKQDDYRRYCITISQQYHQ